MGAGDSWLLLHIFSTQVYITKLKKKKKAYTVQLELDSNLVKLTLYIYFTE